MTQVFIGGSRKISQLNREVQTRLDNIVRQAYTVLVGDALGADKAAQKYLAEQSYQNVVVFCTGTVCRNNLGQWPTEHITPPHAQKDFAYFVAKDLAMVKRADYGLMLWDGQSKGTLNNVLNLLRENKKTLVYFAPERLFFTITNVENLNSLLNKCSQEQRRILEKALAISQPTL